jgi:hypothetical protein
MFQDTELQHHLETSSVIRSQTAVIAEWNMNVAGNIKQVGNYRYRPNDSEDSVFKTPSASFSTEDTIFYTGATDSDTVIDGGFTDSGIPTTFLSKKEKESLLYSLEDCFGKFRPRSGINKLRYFPEKFTHHANPEMSKRPRYYMADRTDPFKYWTSYRTENQIERGIATQIVNGKYVIDDAVPFVVYEDSVPANRIVVKMQTNVGSVDMGTFTNVNGSFSDPFYGDVNQTTPVRWKIQYLNNNDWVDAISFNESSLRKDGTSVVGSDGYVELEYGLIIPDHLKDIFYIAGEYPSESVLPDAELTPTGEAYLVKESDTDAGKYYVCLYGQYTSFDATYGWYLKEDDMTRTTNFVTDLTSPSQYYSITEGKIKYREFDNLGGLRIVVETMNVFDSTFDLIELSPRLAVDISDKVIDFQVKKTASDLGVSGLPVGQLLASVGSLGVFDYDQAFFDQNTNSIVSSYMTQNIQVRLYEVVSKVNGYDYYVPIKTMYSEGFPELSSGDRTANLSLRDLFFYFESMTAPQLVLQDASLSSAIATILDYVGFSNYVFLRVPNEDEHIIPYFYVAPDKTLAEVLSELAVSTQSAMFFDEYNNFVVMSRNYILPSITDRETSLTLIGSADQTDTGVVENAKTGELFDPTSEESAANQKKLSNIMDIASKNNDVYNDGVINYRVAYIQKSVGSIRQANFVDQAKTWIYKPSLLWEVAGGDNTKSVNEEVAQQSGYALTAIPLNSNLSSLVPTVENHQVKNNIIDLGEGVYWLGRYNGYFYANGEVIKFDAVQYSVAGMILENDGSPAWTVGDGNTVWISNVQQYQKYFANVPFNGKIYPTGLVRIYSEPNYEVVEGNTRLKNGEVSKHGRGQFGTTITEHNAGLSAEWASDERLRGVRMDTKYLFSSNYDETLSGIYTRPAYRGDAIIESNYDLPVGAKITTDGTRAIVTSKAHGLAEDDIITFSTTGALPTGLVGGKTYYVSSVVNVDQFSVSASAGGSEINISGTQSGLHSWTLLLGTTPVTVAIDATTGLDMIFTKTAHGLSEGDMVIFQTGETLVTGLSVETPYRVYAVETADTFTLTLNGLDKIVTPGATQTGSADMTKLVYPAIVSLPGHEFIATDKFWVMGALEGQVLPPELSIDDEYFVSSTGLSNSQFMLTATNGGPKLFVTPTEGAEYKVYAVEYGGLVVPNASVIKPGYYVSHVSGTGDIQAGTRVESVDEARNLIFLTLAPPDDYEKNWVDPATGEVVVNSIRIIDKLPTVVGKAGEDNTTAKFTTRNGIVKNFLTNVYQEESTVNKMLSTQAGTVQSSALVMTGGSENLAGVAPDFISYTYKPLDDRFVHFGTRMRIIGKIQNNQYRGQSPYNAEIYYTSTSTASENSVSIGGSSGGIAVMLNPETNNGYYFEIAALTENNLNKYKNYGSMHNVLFYKLQRNAAATEDTDAAIPVKLWGGLSNIVVDSGTLTGQYRMAAEEIPTVYDLSVEYKKVGSSLRFYLYINNVLIATVDDTEPLPIYNNLALFTRGSSKIMFENVYALTNNYSQNTTFSLGTIGDGAFGDLELNASNAFQKYALSGMIQSTYLSGISPNEPPKYKIYFEEFGTIMREAAYMNVRYDKAYPALTAEIAPTFNRIKGYTVSGFVARAYGAEFMIFNSTDSAISLDSTSGNYLRILGIAFTQNSQNELTVDDYFSKRSDMSNPQFVGDSLVISPQKEKKNYQDIKFSRMTHGKKQFSISAPYVQTQDDANRLMSWLTQKIMKPRKSVGLKVFGMPTLQLGDIVTIDYVTNEGVREIADLDTRFVVYSIDYSKSDQGPEMTVYLSEVG